MTRWILSLPAIMLSGISCSSDNLAAPTEPRTSGEGRPAFNAGAGSELFFSQVASGYHHTCGVTIEGRAYCWGWNPFGQLGDGTTTSPHLAPATVSTSLHFREVSAGVHHTCGVTMDNRVYCWGSNVEGQLGDGTTSARLKPVPVASGLFFRQVRAGYHHTCALTTDKRAYCWGRNTSGELGTGRGGNALRPTAVAGGLRFFQITAGNAHSCGKTTDYRGFCWGANDFGKLGDGTTTNRPTPRAVTGGLKFYQLSAGDAHTCGLTPDNTVYCWGWNAGGAIGDGINYFQRLTPTRVAGGLYFRQVVTGSIYSCGLTRASRAYCWGYNGSGQLGDGTTTQRWEPVAVSGGLRFDAAIGLTAGAGHMCGLSTDKKVYCWGFNGNGNLGDGTTTKRLMPVPVTAAIE